MEVGEVNLSGAGWAVEGFDVGDELYEVTGDEAGGEAEMAEEVDEQPGEIATGAAGFGEGFIGGLDAGFHADVVLVSSIDVLVDYRPENH